MSINKMNSTISYGIDNVVYLTNIENEVVIDLIAAPVLIVKTNTLFRLDAAEKNLQETYLTGTLEEVVAAEAYVDELKAQLEKEDAFATETRKVMGQIVKDLAISRDLY